MAKRNDLDPKVALAFMKEHFEYRDGAFYWIKRSSVSVPKHIGDIAGCDDRINSRWTQYFMGKHIKRSRVVWLWHRGEWPQGNLFYINGDSYDDRIENLTERKADLLGEKLPPRPKPPTKETPGITWMPRRGVFRVDVRGTLAGFFPTLDEAVAAQQRLQA